jgi:hypothetical protein
LYSTVIPMNQFHWLEHLTWMRMAAQRFADEMFAMQECCYVKLLLVSKNILFIT